jgi:hypothetical protein
LWQAGKNGDAFALKELIVPVLGIIAVMLIILSPPMFSPQFPLPLPLPFPIPVVTMDRNSFGSDIDILRLKGRWESKNKSGTT